MDKLAQLEFTMNLQNIEFPSHRSDLRNIADMLSDLDYQKIHWENNIPDYKSGIDTFAYVFNVLFDDLEQFSANPAEFIGLILLNHREASATRALAVDLKLLLDRYGPLISPKQAMSDEVWKDVVANAAELKLAMILSE
jgi:hypothetical protein